MNRQALADAVAAKATLTNRDALDAVDAVFASIAEALKAGEEVRVAGFGTFTVAERAASEGRDPRDGEPIQIAASTKAKFRPAKALKDALNPPQPKPAQSRGQERPLAAARSGPTRRASA